VFWRKHRIEHLHTPGEKVYVFTSIFAPTDIEKSIFHRWKRYNDHTHTWEVVEDIGYDITGGRDEGYRGYTFKSNARAGEWKVEVITEEELIIGVVHFELITDPARRPVGVVTQKF